MRALVAFVRLTRPLFLFGGFAGVAFGAALAAHHGDVVEPAAYAWVQCIVTAFQLMVHYANDYFDRDGDRGRARTAWSGGSGVLADGTLPPRTGLVAAAMTGAIGLAASTRFAVRGEIVVAVLGYLMGVLSWIYSAPPVRTVARGAGEANAAIVVGLLVPCAGYAAFAHTLDTAALPAIVTTVAMIAMMLSVEIPDAGSDRLSGKRTLVVRLGVANALSVLTLVAFVATAAAIVSVWGLRSSSALALVPTVVSCFFLQKYTRGDTRPASIAFWGVALYGTTATGLAIAFALAPAA